ncbi:putative O-methyltransferase [Ophiobolus disseminans]|uniref:O-methyltransferase n=1 Tax=Ophiobolus disseminans TaxID=1469910 RepID=A0A6A6ZP15_9PLEO|nr:putative O-methyltransferase [Ophiobolus disseminans]
MSSRSSLLPLLYSADIVPTSLPHHTHLIDTYFSSDDLPHPSLDSPIPTLPSDIEHSRTIVLQATQELNDLLQGPRGIRKFPTQHTHLATNLEVAETPLKQILRMGIAHRVFSEPRPGILTHSAASRLIREDEDIRARVGAGVEKLWLAAGRIVDALERWKGRGNTEETGFALAHGEPFYNVPANDSARTARFAKAMSSFTAGLVCALVHLVKGFAWEKLESGGTIVDVGGSTGDAAFALARQYRDRKFKFAVQDLSEVVAGVDADRLAEAKELGVEFQAHDFFEIQPVQGADVYVFRWILHNLPDAYCVRMLRALEPALKKDARVLVMEMVLSPLGALPNDVERKVRAMDLTMLETGNARERELEEWQKLVASSDERFVWRGMRQPEGSRLAVLEWVWDG